MAAQRPNKFTSAERTFWKDSFLAYELPAVLRQGQKITPIGLAHLSADFADAAVREYRRRFK